MRHCYSIKPVFSPVLTLALTGLLLSGPIKAAPTEAPKIAFNIPQQKLTSALTKFAEQTGVQLLYSAKLAENLSAHAVNGQYTSNQALAVLLEGSGISYHYVDKNVITLEKSPQKAPEQLNKVGPTTLKPVNVTATAVRDVKDPYNEDYVLPNATSGTKTDTPIMDTPLNVQVISKQVLKDQQIIYLGDALKNVSGVTIGASGDLGTTQNIFLRGFSSETYFRNGFRMTQGSANREMSNVESVEVMKGPAAILYGMVEPGGMVNVITKQPLASPYYALNQQFGSYNLYRTTIDATGPIADNKNVLYRMNMSYQNNGSFRDFVDNEDIFVAPIVKWNISPKTQITAELEYNHKQQGQNMSAIPWVNGGLLNIPRNQTYGEYSPEIVDTIFGSLNWSHQFNEDWQIKHKFSVNQTSDNFLHFANANSYSGGSTISRYNVSLNNQYNTYSTNLDLTGHFDTWRFKHTLLIGGDYYRTNNNSGYGAGIDVTSLAWDLSSINIFNPVHPGTPYTQPIATYLQINNQTDQYGAYIQDQIKLPFDVHVMGGIRYQNFHQVTDSSMPNWFYGGSQSSTAQSQDAVTPRVGLLWKAQNWLSLYTNYAESFGMNQGLLYPGKTPPPTSAEQYEGGVKTEFFDGRLRATLAYYDLTKTNVMTTDMAHLGFSISTGAVRSRGPELDIIGEILPGWNVIANYANTDARVVKSNDGGIQAVGTRFYGVPRNMASLWNTFEPQNTLLKGVKVGGGVTIRDGQTTCCDTPSVNLPGYATVDMLAAYSLKVGKSKLSLQLNVNNLLDKNYFTNGQITAGNYGNVIFGTPRTFMGSIGIQY